MSSDEIRAGSSEMMTHAQRQAFLKTSSLGKLFGVAHLLPEVTEAKQEIPKYLSHLKRVRGLFKDGELKNDQHYSKRFRNLVDMQMHYPGNTLDKSRTKSGKDGRLTDSLGRKINLRR